MAEHGIGTVRLEERNRSLVFWDDDFDAAGQWISTDTPEDRWYDTAELQPVEASAGLPLIYAPEIQDLEFAVRLHPKTHTLVMERSPAYRGGPGPVIADAHDVYDLFKHMAELSQEHIVVILLDVRHNLLGWEVPHKGQLAQVEANAKDILKAAFLMNAAKVVILHNHPSGDPGPSDADADLTEALQVLANEFGVELFDHVIIGRECFFSFREAGEIPEQQLDDD